MYRVKLNLPKKVLRISSTKLSFLNEISTAYQQLPFFKRSAQLTHLTKVCCSDLFTHRNDNKLTDRKVELGVCDSQNLFRDV